MNLWRVGYKFDVVFVVDASYYGTPMMTKIKEIIFGTIDILPKAMNNAGRDVEQLRMRVINFADFANEGENAIRSTEFFTMPLERDNLEQAIEDTAIHCSGGNAPKNGLEALYTAMKSDWVNIGCGINGRHIIILLSKSYPLSLGERDGCVGYNKSEYPANIEKLTDKWDADCQSTSLKLSPINRRLSILVPYGADENGHTWDPISDWEWCSTICSNSEEAINELEWGDLFINSLIDALKDI